MKYFILLICFVPLVSFSQRFDRPLHAMYKKPEVLENKISSVSRRKIKMIGDSVIYNKVVQQINFETTGNPLEQITWNEWGSDSSITDLRPFSLLAETVRPNNCDYKNLPVLQSIKEITRLTCLPEEFTAFVYGDIKMEKTAETNEMIEYISAEDTSRHHYHYFLPDIYLRTSRQSDSKDSLDMRIIILIDLKNKWVECQTAGIYDPPTDVPQTAYHRTVYYYDFSMKLLWKDEYRANLAFFDWYDQRSRTEYKESQTVYDYYENGLLKRELTFFESNPYDFRAKGGIYMEQVLYEITYRE